FDDERAAWQEERMRLQVEIAELRSRPAAQRSPRQTATQSTRSQAKTDAELAELVCDLAVADPGVLGGWKPMAAALRAKGHGLGTDRARRVLELARARTK